MVMKFFCDFLGLILIYPAAGMIISMFPRNYEAVQIHGKVEIMNHDELYAHLDKLTSKYESFQQCPMMVKDMGKEFVEKEMKGAFGIKVIPTEIFIKQNFLRTEKRMILTTSLLNLSNLMITRKIAEKMKLIKK